jgi:hypothetical protein
LGPALNTPRIVDATALNGTFDPFLMETFGMEENGMALTVLSALARLGLDPWAEAEHLAALPTQAAAAAIARHLALNGDLAVATRLAGLLPNDADTAAVGNRAERLCGAVRRNIWLWVMFWLAASVFFVMATAPHRLTDTAADPAASSNGFGDSGTR